MTPIFDDDDYEQQTALRDDSGRPLDADENALVDRLVGLSEQRRTRIV